MIYHGVCISYSGLTYSIGVALLDIDDPSTGKWWAKDGNGDGGHYPLLKARASCSYCAMRSAHRVFVTA